MNLDNNNTPCFPITLHFLDLSYTIKKPDPKPTANLKRVLTQTQQEKTILKSISGHVSPGQLLAVLGPSGCGKSTLLTILAGRLKHHSGSVLLNGNPISKPISKRVGFVTQDDVLYPHLTVRETLVFCAMLRLPNSLSKSEKIHAAEFVIKELGLEKCAETRVGNGFVRGVSGGERKRVSVAHEMLVNPSLLILDEPTSGLDSTVAAKLVGKLGEVARKGGRSVVMSVHQPSSRVYQMFDLVMVVMEGECVYFGKGREAMDYFTGVVGFGCLFHVNPADFMLDLANGIVQTEQNGEVEKPNVKQALVSSYNRVLAPKVKASITAAVNTATAPTIGIQRSEHSKQNNCSNISWFSQFKILLSRSLKERRHETFDSLRVIQVIAAALLAGLMWWHSNIRNVQDRLGLLFFISIFLGVFASFNAVFTFPSERAIFIKERASGMYTLSSYFMARMAGDLPMELILPSVFSVILYWMAGLRPEIEAFLLTVAILLAYVLVAQGLGLVLGAAIMDAKQASTVVTVTMLAFLLTGGFYVQHIPSWMAWMKYTSFTFYCYRLLIGVQYKGQEMEHYLSVSHYRHGDESGEDEILTQVSIGMSILAMVVMFVGYRVLAYVALRRMKA